MKLSSLLLVFITNFVFGQNIQKLEIPLLAKKDTIFEHKAYSVSYNHHFRQPNWVAYQLTKVETIKVIDRSDKFKPDPLIKGTDNAVDYKGSGYDRGHLAPSADMTFSKVTMEESFYFSNMSPQNPSFNRGIWSNLEEQVRDWAKEFDSLYIVVGPILNDSLIRIGTHHVAVPKYYFKVILDNRKGHQKAIGFIMENQNSKLPLEHFAVSIDKVEQLTHMDFYSLLPNEQEQKIEQHVCLECWFH